MNKAKATKLYLKGSKQARIGIERLLKWKDGMSIEQYAKKLNTCNAQTWIFANRYGLKFINRSKHAGEARKKYYRKYYTELWDSTKTLHENARAVDKTYTYATQIARKYGLDYKFRKVIHLGTQITIDKVINYKSKGLSNAEIGRILNKSRERIRQILELIGGEK